VVETATGHVYAWGDNPDGQLGDGTTTSTTTPVEVEGVGGSGSLSDVVGLGQGSQATYAVLAPPTVTGISPKAGPLTAGTSVTITGTHLTGASAVDFGTSAATGITVVSPTQLTVSAPAGSAGTVNVTVTTPWGTSATSAADEYTYDPKPTVTSLSPTSGPVTGGTTVTITGTGFTTTSTVDFGTTGAARTVTVVSATEITAVAPPGTGTVYVRVTTPGGRNLVTATGEYTFVPLPTVTGISPKAGPLTAGTKVTITGTHLTGASAVDFGTAAATTVTIVSATKATAVAPAGSAGTVNVTVTTLGGTSAVSAADEYTYDPVPTVTSLSPTFGTATGGTTITITGSGFTSTSTVDFGTTAAPIVTVASATEITAVTPVGTAGRTVAVSVTSPGGTGTKTGAFTYSGGQLVVSCGSPGTTVSATLGCAVAIMPTITLNGATQHVEAAMSTIYVSTRRGKPTVGWTLSATVVPTASTENTNPACATVAAFCNSGVATHAKDPQGQIPAKDLAISAPTCTPAATSTGAVATPGAAGDFTGSLTLCSAAPGSSGGTFSVNTTFTLRVPSTVYAGVYFGTVEYLVMSTS
jgi:hypothetical protein